MFEAWQKFSHILCKSSRVGHSGYCQDIFVGHSRDSHGIPWALSGVGDVLLMGTPQIVQHSWFSEVGAGALQGSGTGSLELGTSGIVWRGMRETRQRPAEEQWLSLNFNSPTPRTVIYQTSLRLLS